MAKPGRKPKLTVVGKGDLTHDNTSNALTDDQVQALFFSNKTKIASLKGKVATATADLRNAYKAAKADGFSKKDFDFAFELEDDEDDKVIERRRREEQIARWHGHPIGTQSEMDFGTPTSPSQRERGFAEGKRDAFEDKVCKTDYAPGTEGYEGYMEGWHQGSAIKSNAAKEQEEGAALLLRPESNEPDGPDAFDAAADDAPEPPSLDGGEAVDPEPWPDDAILGQREPAEVL